jgi:hypothetical protein
MERKEEGAHHFIFRIDIGAEVGTFKKRKLIDDRTHHQPLRIIQAI